MDVHESVSPLKRAVGFSGIFRKPKGSNALECTTTAFCTIPDSVHVRGGTMSPSQGTAKGRTVTLTNPASPSLRKEIATFLKAIDCYVLGSRTYEHALELGWPYGDTPVVVVSSREWPPASTRKTIKFYSGDLKTLVDEKLAPRYQNIWLVGGAMLSQRFLELGLVDEIRLTIAPVLLGAGLRLFGGSLRQDMWDLKNVIAYKNGFVELSYSAPMA
jgi:dihydrofolate reductase